MPKQKQKQKPINETKILTETLIKISEAITSDLYVDDILKLLVTITAETLGSKICSLMLVDFEKKELAIKATQSLSEEYIKKPNIKIGDGIAGKVAQLGEPVSVYDLTKDARFLSKNIAKKEKLKSLLSVPMIMKGKVVGVLNCYTTKLHKFTKDEIALVRSIANQAAIILDNFRLVVETELVKEELENRKKIEKAKGILMKRDKITEEEAYKYLRKYSMDKRKTMKEIADAIIMMDDLKL